MSVCVFSHRLLSPQSLLVSVFCWGEVLSCVLAEAAGLKMNIYRKETLLRLLFLMVNQKMRIHLSMPTHQDNLTEVKGEKRTTLNYKSIELFRLICDMANATSVHCLSLYGSFWITQVEKKPKQLQNLKAKTLRSHRYVVKMEFHHQGICDCNSFVFVWKLTHKSGRIQIFRSRVETCFTLSH